jgi:hypothetical protein
MADGRWQMADGRWQMADGEIARTGQILDSNVPILSNQILDFSCRF